jgi:putative membrane protein
MTWWNHSWGFGWGWIVVMGVAMVVCMAMMARMMMGHSGAGRMWPGARGRMWPAGDRDEDTPERILARRLASGEIDVAEFERLRDALQQTSNSTTGAAGPGGGGPHSPPA